ncbi:MAG: DUF1844 domain-containing protein [Armatimonadetes bacterium]|nr:DUF1844 domain-containing protein [Armatimonadota bacterium]
MPDDVRREDDEIRESYHKVDQRDWLHEDEKGEAQATAGEGDTKAPAAEPAAEPTETAPAGEAMPEVDTYGVLRLFVSMLIEQAWVQLGVRLAPGAKETRTDLKQAKLAIDTLAYLKDALADNLLPDEKREVEQVLATLRLNYVQRS